MPIPGQTITIRDPGLGIIEIATNTPLYYGASELAGAGANVLATYSNPNDLIAAYGQGPMPEAAADHLSRAGGPVRVMKSDESVASSIGSVTKTAVGSSTGDISTTPPSGDAHDDYEVHVEITTTGTLGAGEFKYSLDDGRNFSADITIPAGGSYVIPNTGLTITFTPGAGPIFFEDGDLHEFDAVAAMWNATDLGVAVTALLADSTDWDYMVACGRHADATAAATIFSALDGHLTTFETAFQYRGAIMDAGNDTEANVVTAFASITSRRVLVAYGDADRSTAKPIVGWNAPRTPMLTVIATIAGRSLISTDLGRVASGPFSALAISHDEFRTENLDAAKISTSRTFPGLTGFFVTNANLKSPAGSDFQFWQHRRIMDVACKTVVTIQNGYISMGLRTNDDGTIDERDAVRLETRAENALRAVLTEPQNVEGVPGHVSDLAYQIDRANNIQSTGILNSQTDVRPLGYVKDIQAQIGYAVQL